MLTRSVRSFLVLFHEKRGPAKVATLRAQLSREIEHNERTNERDTPKNLFISDRIEAGAEISKRSSLSSQEMLARHITRSLRDFMEDSDSRNCQFI